MAERQKVFFAYIPRHQWNGSKAMRVDQLCAIADLHLGHRYDFQPLMLFREGQNRAMRFVIRELIGSIVIFLKGGGSCFSEDGLHRLSDLARGICIDHVDGYFGAGKAFPFADVHIVASHAGQKAAEALLPEAPEGRVKPGAKAMHLTHHPDPRVQFRDASADETLRMGYFGLMKNTTMPEEVSARLQPEDLEPQQPFLPMLARMQTANLHYAVRPTSRARLRGAAVFKPFTKGFNAARAGANMVINREADDAIEYLGADYPYLADLSDPASIVDAVERAEKGVGGAEWRRGLEAMADVRRRSSHDFITSELRAILEHFD